MPGAPLRIQPAKHGKARPDLPPLPARRLRRLVCHSGWNHESAPSGRASAGSGTSATRTATRSRRATGAARSGPGLRRALRVPGRSRPWSSRRCPSGASSPPRRADAGERLVPTDDVRARKLRALPHDAVLALQGHAVLLPRVPEAGLVEEDARGRTHKEACGSPVSYRGFSARGDVPRARRGPRRRPTPRRISCRRGRVPARTRPRPLAGRRIPPLRELCARALPIGTEIPPTSMQTDNGNEEKVVTKVGNTTAPITTAGMSARAGAGPGSASSRRKRPRTPPRRSPTEGRTMMARGVAIRHGTGPPSLPPATTPPRPAAALLHSSRTTAASAVG